MSKPHIIKRKINNAIYVYEIIKSYRDKKTGKPRNKQRCLGRLDEDGALITKRRKLPAKITMIRKTTTKLLFEDIKNKN